MSRILLHRKDSIVLTTIDVINEYGIQGVSTREVAKREGISEAAVFKHFHRKSELIHAVIDYYAQNDYQIMAATRMQTDPKGAILFYVAAYADYFENYPQITAITLSYEVLACDPHYRNKIRNIYYSRKMFMLELVSHAQQAGVLTPNLDAEQLTDIIWGFFRSVCQKWRFNDYSFSLKNYVTVTVQALLDAFINNRKRV